MYTNDDDDKPTGLDKLTTVPREGRGPSFASLVALAVGGGCGHTQTAIV